MPVIFQNPPAAFDGVVFAVVWRIIGQAYGDVIALDKFHQALHELGTPAVALWTIVQIDEQCLDVGKALFDGLPPVDETIHQTIAGDLGGDPIEKEFIRSW